MIYVSEMPFFLNKRRMGGNLMVKRAIIEVELVEESAEKSNEEIEEEILRELSENIHVIPWAKTMKRVVVEEI